MKQIKTFWEPNAFTQNPKTAEEQCNDFLKEKRCSVHVKRVEHIFNNVGSYMGLTIHYIDYSNEQQ